MGPWAGFWRDDTALEVEQRARVTEQPCLGIHCSPHMGRGLLNPGLKIAVSHLPGQLAVAGGDPFSAVKTI